MKRFPNISRTFLVILCVLFFTYLSSCNQYHSLPSITIINSTQNITSQKPEPSNTPQNLESKTPINSPTDSSTNPLATPDASIPLSKDGPWLIFMGETGLWAVNSDGSGLSNIVKTPSNYFGQLYSTLPFEASPGGKWLAFSYNATEETKIEQEQSLFLLSFPDLSLKKVTSLYSDKSKLQVRKLPIPSMYEPVPTDEEEFVFGEMSGPIRGAITMENSLAWSSIGDRLAFSAALDGPSTDVYVLDMASSSIIRITDGPTTQAVNLFWTPDDKYIIHTATGDLSVERSGPALVDNELWAADPTGLDTHLVAKRLRSIIRWINNEEFLGYESEIKSEYDYNEYIYNLSIINVRTSKEKLLWKDPFMFADVDPMSKSVFIDPMEVGMYILKAPDFSPIQIVDSNNQVIKFESPIYWLKQIDKFAGFIGDRLVMISPTGDISEVTMNPDWTSEDIYYDIVFSPSGKDWVLIPSQGDRQGIWIYQEGIGLKEISPEGACKAIWRPDGKAIFFYTDYFWNDNTPNDGSIYIAEAPDYQPRLIKTGLTLNCTIEPQWLFK